MMNERPVHIAVQDLTMAYGDFVIQRDLNFEVKRGDIFIVMGGSGCGKSTLLRHLIGLQAPASGRVLYGATDFWAAPEGVRQGLMRRMGVGLDDLEPGPDVPETALRR